MNSVMDHINRLFNIFNIKEYVRICSRYYERYKALKQAYFKFETEALLFVCTVDDLSLLYATYCFYFQNELLKNGCCIL